MAYLLGTAFAGGLWGFLFYHRRDLRKKMLWSSLYFFTIMMLGFIVLRFLGHYSVAESINPGYWFPPSLFGLNNLTGGYGIEDAFFMFFIGGIAAAIYEELFRHRSLRYRKLPHRPHLAVVIAVIAAGIFATVSDLNLVWAIIVFGAVGAAVIWIERRDLIRESLGGGAASL